jgi:acetyl-CoA carboxylase beta subunit
VSNTNMDQRIMECPACKKRRLYKDMNPDGTVDPVSTTTFEVRGKKRFQEVCQKCAVRYFQEDMRFAVENLDKMQDVAQDRQTDTTDHTDFSIDL